MLFPSGDLAPFVKQVVSPQAYMPDAFEYVYFARPESVIDGISVYHARQEMGYELADAIHQTIESASTVVGKERAMPIDVVVPVPETSYVAALAVAQRLQLPLAFGLVKNGYVMRTFIMSGQAQRHKSVWRKLTAVREVFMGCNVLLVDDSIVRGTTSRDIIEMVREAGAQHITFASASPPIRSSHIYGIDLGRRSDLMAYCRTDEEIAKAVGSDTVVYLTPEALGRALRHARVSSQAPVEFELGMFTGVYATPGADEYITTVDGTRN